MDLRQLAALTAVAEAGTFSAAADLLHTVQSNVSSHVARLERELGVTLVDRAAGRLTQEGDAVVARARRINGELEALVADVAAMRDQVAGNVGIGVLRTTGRWLVPKLLAAMAERHPRVRVNVLEGNTTSLVPPVVSGQLDQAVVNLPVDDPDVSIEMLFEEDLVLAVPEKHELANREEVTMAEIAETELLLLPKGTAFRADVDAAAEAAGVELRAKTELDGLTLIASLTFEGFGPSILPATAIPGWLTGPWRVIRIAGIPLRPVGLARRRRALPSAPARALREVLRDVILDESAKQPGVHPTLDAA